MIHKPAIQFQAAAFLWGKKHHVCQAIGSTIPKFTIATYGWMVCDIALRTLNRCFTCCRHVGVSSPHFLVNLPVFAARHRSANWKRRRSGGFSTVAMVGEFHWKGNHFSALIRDLHDIFSVSFLNFFSFSFDKPNGW